MSLRKDQLVFLCLILAQAAHSIEEYFTGLYNVFAPARFVSSLVSSDLSFGFLIVNTCLIVFGLWCWVVPVQSGWAAEKGIVWFWVVLELLNGFGHIILAFSRRSYFPGVATAPLLLVFAAWTAVTQGRHR